MRPLAVGKHLLDNSRRTFPVFAAVSLSVFLIYTMQAIIGVPLKTTYREFVEPYRHASGYVAKTSPISSEFVDRLAYIDGVSVFPCTYSYTNIDSVISGMLGTQVIAFRGDDLSAALRAFDLSLREGHLPRTNTNEIVLHELVAQNRGLRIGNAIGSDVQVGEVLEGQYTVCGILQGESILSMTSLEYELGRRNIPYEYSLGLIVIPRAGQLQAMNQALAEIDNGGLVKHTLQTVTRQYEQDISSISALTSAIEIMTIIIVSLCAGFLSFIHFQQRRSEFGILSAIGYTQSQIINWAFAEISLVNLAGFLAGLLLSAVAVLALSVSLFVPKGLSLMAIDPLNLLRCGCVPLFTTLFSIIPIWRMLRSLDAASVLEGQA
jgi:ABC-type lipoprotein release transport system permease subunit